MSIQQLSEQIAAMNCELESLQRSLDDELAVEAIRRGLASTSRGLGKPPSEVISTLRHLHVRHGARDQLFDLNAG